MRIRRSPAPAVAGAVLTAFFAALTACSSGGPGAAGTQQPGVIDVSGSQCGGTWSVPGPGWHTIQISNQGTGGAEIDLDDPANGAVYAEIENTGPGTVNPISIDFGSGKYALVCLFSDASPLKGVTVTVPGHATGTPAVLPVTYNDLIPPAKTYQAETETALKVLAPETATLAAAVRSGNLTAARRDWLTAHLQYETLGDAYDAFGHFDTEIDGRADATGVASPQWTGFYRLEYGLWRGQSLASLVPVASGLNSDVDQLAAWWQTQQVPLADLGRRAHEVIENALEFQLTGHDDYGSGTTLASTVASITASRVLLALLHPLLAPRYPGLPAVYTGLSQLQSLLEKEQLPNGWWVPVSALPDSARLAIDAACGQVLQELAPVASITEPRNTVNDF
ncbi:imelysin family protein [Trebonia sp.]|uniref:imelysin family protein n=2 Tax=Trebonia sp. TaxID=2767075 RepID=UPI003BAF365B